MEHSIPCPGSDEECASRTALGASMDSARSAGIEQGTRNNIYRKMNTNQLLLKRQFSGVRSTWVGSGKEKRNKFKETIITQQLPKI